MKTKKYGFGNLLFCNEFTYSKLEEFINPIAVAKLHMKLKTFKDFKIIVKDEIVNDMIYFYIERINNGEIVEFKLKDLL